MSDAPAKRKWVTARCVVLSMFVLMTGQAWSVPVVVPAVPPTVPPSGPASALPSVGESTAPGPGRVLAIGDIHGDFEAITIILREIGLIDEENHWVGGDTTLIQTGDFTDRGPDVRKVMDLLMRLQIDAAEQGGRVEVLIANHEGMNLVDFWRDNSPADYEAFIDDKSEERQAEAYDEYVDMARRRAKALNEREPQFTSEVRGEWLKGHPLGFVERMEAFGPEGVYGKWLRQLPIAVRIDDTIFIHGGINQQLAEWSLEEINERVRQEIEDFDTTKRTMIERKLIVPFATLQDMVDAAAGELQRILLLQERGRRLGRSETETAQILEKFLTINSWLVLHPEGPLWFRGYDRWPDVGGEALIDDVLNKLDAKHIVVGHSPQVGAIRPRFGGKIFLIDTGMLASHYNGRASALEIQDGKFTAIYGGERELLLDTSEESSGGGSSVGRLTLSISPAWTALVASGIPGSVATTGALAAISAPAAPSAAAAATNAGNSAITPTRRWYGPDGEDLPLRTDDQILDFLASAEIVDRGGVGEGIAKAQWVILERDGVRMRAIFHDIDQKLDRIRIGGAFYLRFTDSWRAQCGAYELSRLMGLDNVPPTVERRIGGNRGSLQAWVEDGMTDMKRREKQLRPPDYKRYIQESRIMQVWDNLIYNIDRHAGNILFDPHWNIWFIDHTRAFEFKTELLDVEQITQVERSFWEHLQDVDDATIRAALDPYIVGSDVTALLQRRQMIVDRINQLIEERGEGAVVFDLDTHSQLQVAASSEEAAVVGGVPGVVADLLEAAA
jgi:hypothetical protein